LLGEIDGRRDIAGVHDGIRPNGRIRLSHRLPGDLDPTQGRDGGKRNARLPGGTGGGRRAGNPWGETSSLYALPATEALTWVNRGDARRLGPLT
jgi:hypothetical protein